MKSDNSNIAHLRDDCSRDAAEKLASAIRTHLDVCASYGAFPTLAGIAAIPEIARLIEAAKPSDIQAAESARAALEGEGVARARAA